MSYKTASYRLTGIAPLLMHNGQLANPIGYYAKELKKVSGKRVKTDADFERMAEIEFKGGLYLTEEHGPVIPGDMIEAMLTEAAKKQRKGQQVKAGVIVDGAFPLEYDGPRDADKLWQNERYRLVKGVKIQKNRVMRTRPRFLEWKLEAKIDYMASVINKTEIDDMMVLAGEQVGLGDWRPRYGRFLVEAL